MCKSKGILLERELRKVLMKLQNPQDRFIVAGIFYGICGDKYCDLVELKVKDVNVDIGIIRVGVRNIEINDLLKKIIKDTIEEKTYEKYGATLDSSYDFNQASEYVLKTKPSSVTENGTTPMKYGGLRIKVQRLALEVGEDFSLSTLETSGIINRVLKLKKDWTVRELDAYFIRQRIKINAFRVYEIIKELKEQGRI